MFDIDRWREILQNINKNKLRSVMSGFTVFFAILLFTLLFGISKGLGNFFKEAFADDTINFMKIRVWKTSIPYKGLQSGREIKLDNNDFNYVNQEYKDQINYLSAIVFKNFSIRFKNKSDLYSVKAVHPDYQFLEKSVIENGRFLNRKDLKKKAKVIIIGKKIKEDLFGEKPAVGKRININGSSFFIIGVFSDNGNDNEERIAYMPITTAQLMYGNNNYINQIVLGYKPELSLDAAIDLGYKIEDDLRKKLNIHPDDQSALSLRNMAKANKNVDQFMFILFFIVLVVGFGTLVAGIIGISNIMIFVIKERTKEFGIRKAIGAQPASIIGLVVQESILITTIAGYIGLFTGTFILKSAYIKKLLENYFIKDPDVSPIIVFFATIILILSGLIAGYIPAKKAANIKPMEALRVE